MPDESAPSFLKKIFKWPMWIVIVLGVLTMIVVVWILFFAGEDPLLLSAPTPTVTPTVTYTPTSTPMPTATERPTLTPPSTLTSTPTPSETPISTATSTATPTLSPAATPVARYESDGLGLTQVDWEAAHSATGLGATLGQTQAKVYDGVYAVLFINGNVGWIDRAWTMGAGVTGAEALALGESFAPLDRQPVRSYFPTELPGTMVSIYYSPSLADRFPVELWGAESPGTFAIVTIADGEEVVRLLLLLGDPAAVLG